MDELNKKLGDYCANCLHNPCDCKLDLHIVSNWHSLDVKPPYTLVEVQDENGNIAKAYPTYYPFKMGENKTGVKWGSEIIHCEPYWDGGWLIECEGLESYIDSSIVRWRACC